MVFYSFSRPTFNGGLPIVARLALVKGAASFLFCLVFVCFLARGPVVPSSGDQLGVAKRIFTF